MALKFKSRKISSVCLNCYLAFIFKILSCGKNEKKPSRHWDKGNSWNTHNDLKLLREGGFVRSTNDAIMTSLPPTVKKGELGQHLLMLSFLRVLSSTKYSSLHYHNMYQLRNSSISCAKTSCFTFSRNVCIFKWVTQGGWLST